MDLTLPGVEVITACLVKLREEFRDGEGEVEVDDVYDESINLTVQDLSPYVAGVFGVNLLAGSWKWMIFPLDCADESLFGVFQWLDVAVFGEIDERCRYEHSRMNIPNAKIDDDGTYVLDDLLEEGRFGRLVCHSDECMWLYVDRCARKGVC